MLYMLDMWGGHDHVLAKNVSVLVERPTDYRHPNTHTFAWLSQVRASKTGGAHTLFWVLVSRRKPGTVPCRVVLRLSMHWLFDTLLWLDRWVLVFSVYWCKTR